MMTHPRSLISMYHGAHEGGLADAAGAEQQELRVRPPAAVPVDPQALLLCRREDAHVFELLG